MNLPRRKFFHLAAGAFAAPAIARHAVADAYPSRPVRLLVGFTPAGGNDIVARLMGQWLTVRLGQTFVIENRPGAGTNIAAEVVINSPPDGYTLFVTNLSNAINATLYEKLNFNFMRDMLPVAGIAQAPAVFAINSSVPAKTVTEFIAHAKANPGRINMGSAGIGSTGHLAGELFKMMAGVNLIHVPYRGNAPALTDRRPRCPDRAGGLADRSRRRLLRQQLHGPDRCERYRHRGQHVSGGGLRLLCDGP